MAAETSRTAAARSRGNAVCADLVQQRALARIPRGDALARGTVELPKVLLDLPKIRKQLARSGLDLNEPIFNLRGIEKPDVAAPNAVDFRIEPGFAFLELGDANVGIGLRAFRNLPKQLEDHHEPRLGTDERPLLQAGEPFDDAFGGGRDVEVGLVALKQLPGRMRAP
jgi:hypothetical protein